MLLAHQYSGIAGLCRLIYISYILESDWDCWYVFTLLLTVHWWFWRDVEVIAYDVGTGRKTFSPVELFHAL
jgi:hypothetical protein